LIDRFFNKIKQCRRFATRYDDLQPCPALVLQFGTGPAADAVEKIVFANLDQAGRSERLDNRQRRADEAMLVAAAVVIVSGDFTA
jgi:hypothetical protein